METCSPTNPVRVDNILSAIVIAVAFGLCCYGALSSVLVPLAA